jgi:hypothetical protein
VPLSPCPVDPRSPRARGERVGVRGDHTETQCPLSPCALDPALPSRAGGAGRGEGGDRTERDRPPYSVAACFSAGTSAIDTAFAFTNSRIPCSPSSRP